MSHTHVKTMKSKMRKTKQNSDLHYIGDKDYKH